MGSDTSIDVVHNMAARRFQAEVAGHRAVSEYISLPDRIIFTHTGVPRALEGKGVGTALVKAGLEYAQAQGLQVVPLCPYVAGYMTRHPEWQELLAPGYKVG
jgi:hypothetical protein